MKKHGMKILAAATLGASMLAGVLAGAASARPLNWANLPRKEVVTTGAGVAWVPFKTTDSQSYAGYFGAAADSQSGHLERRLWISETPGGVPLMQHLAGRAKCDVRGVEVKLSWSQADAPARAMTCKLNRRTAYYLNHQQFKFGAGPAPTASARLIRSASTSGTP